ncbi:MAG: regulatory protein RecX, partial [Armatimonadota bacterium]
VGRPAPPNLASRAAQEESQAAMRYAIRLLARQDRTTAELAQRLRRRCFAPEAVATVLSRLTRQGYLDDAKHAERLVNDRLTRNPHGRRAIEWMLRKKGVPGDIIQTCLDRHFQGVDETQMATELARRRLQRLRGLDEARVRNRLASFLSRRGFDYEAVRCALDRVLPDADE